MSNNVCPHGTIAGSGHPCPYCWPPSQIFQTPRAPIPEKMTIRQHAALMAMQGLLANSALAQKEAAIDWLPDIAKTMADACLKAERESRG